MVHQDARRERVGVGQRRSLPDRLAQRFEGRDEFVVGLGHPIERPALAQQPPAAVVLCRHLQPDRTRGLLRHHDARRRHPDARQRTAEARGFQRFTGCIAVTAVTDQQQFKAAGPFRRLRIVDVRRRGIESLPSLFRQPVKTVAADLGALEPAVRRQPRHRGTHHAAVDVEGFEKSQQRAEPDRATARHDGISEHGDDERPGAGRLALELAYNAGERMLHEKWLSAFP